MSSPVLVPSHLSRWPTLLDPLTAELQRSTAIYLIYNNDLDYDLRHRSISSVYHIYHSRAVFVAGQNS